MCFWTIMYMWKLLSITKHGFERRPVARINSHAAVVDVVDNLSVQQINHQQIVESLQWKQHLKM